MDFDDDSLDDLLRDSSANKFKKPVISNVTDELLSNSIPQSARKEKKSALLAELFGPSSTTSFSAIESNLDDQDKTPEKFGSVINFSTNALPEAGRNYVPSAAKSSGRNSNPASLGFQPTTDLFQPSSLAFEKTKIEKNSSQINFEDSPKRTTYEAIDESTFERGSAPVPTVSELKSDSEWNSKVQIQLPAPNFPPTPFPSKPKLNTTQAFKENTQLSPAGVIPFTFQQPKNEVSNEVMNVTNLATIKEVLENFSNTFCTRLEKLTTKSEGLSEITGCLVELHKSINNASQNYINNSISAIPNRMENGDFEKRILLLESRLESATQDNASLRARLDFVENQLRENRNESSRIKLDTETVVESHLKWMREAVNNLDNKISSHSFQSKQAGDENSKSSASAKQEEILQLLKAEVKWLQRQKGKLKNDRADLQVLERQIQGKLQLVDGLSAVLNFYSHKLVRVNNFNLSQPFRKFRELHTTYNRKVWLSKQGYRRWNSYGRKFLTRKTRFVR